MDPIVIPALLTSTRLQGGDIYMCVCVYGCVCVCVWECVCIHIICVYNIIYMYVRACACMRNDVECTCVLVSVQ